MTRWILFVAALIAVPLSAQITPEVSAWIRNTTGQTGYAGLPANVQLVQYSAANVYVSCSCIPGYDIGPWQGNPNIPSNKNFVFKFTRMPQKNNGTLTKVGLGHVGVWSNGVSIDNAWDAQTYNNQGVWQRNALVFEGKGFDNCLGHPQQGGEYHHHVNPTCLYSDTDSTHHSPIIGYMFDGYPVYGAYAYTNTDGTGSIRRMASSFRTRTMTDRTTLPNGSAATSAGPAISTQYPLGSFLQDFEYVAGSGDLDEHNGRFCVTPDYPNGTYAYFVTIDENRYPTFPFVIGDTYYGTVQAGNTGPNSGHNTPSELTTTYSGTTSVEEIPSPIAFEIEPSQYHNVLYVYFSETSANNVVLDVFNTQGTLVQSMDNLQPSIGYAVDLSHVPSGVYVLRFTSTYHQISRTIVKVP